MSSGSDCSATSSDCSESTAVTLKPLILCTRTARAPNLSRSAASVYRELYYDLTCGKLQCLRDLVDTRSAVEWDEITRSLRGLKARLGTEEGTEACMQELTKLKEVLSRETYSDKSLHHFHSAIGGLRNYLRLRDVDREELLENVLVDYWLAITHYEYEPEREGQSVALHLIARRALGRDIVRENLAQSATQSS